MVVYFVQKGMQTPVVWEQNTIKGTSEGGRKEGVEKKRGDVQVKARRTASPSVA